MKVRVVSIPVQDQEKALDFYTTKLNFVKKLDIPLGGENRWLTVVPAEDLEGPEVLLEPAPKSFEPAKVYQNELFEAGIPLMQFSIDDLTAEYDRLTQLDVQFMMTPTNVGSAKIAVFNDTCGNYIQLVELL